MQGKKVAVFGLARSGLAVAEALKRGGANVTAWDDSEIARATATYVGQRTDGDRLQVNTGIVRGAPAA